MMIDKINQELLNAILNLEILQQDALLKEMVLYSVGFDPVGKLIGGGKRLRPMITGLVCGAICGNWEPAIQYGISLEILHNFSLVHDDIEDQSTIRHKLPTVWKKWGIPISINVGDMLLSIAYRTIHRTAAESHKLEAVNIFDHVIENLTLGQHLDISFETRDVISEKEYLSMIHGKTVSLFGGCCALGVLAAGTDDLIIEDFVQIGECFGYAFQIRDDYLGIWGDEKILGKSVSSDITSKKKTLPVIYAAEHNPEFKTYWEKYNGDISEVGKISEWLLEIGADRYTDEKCIYYSEKAGQLLNKYNLNKEYQKKLTAFSYSLLERIK
ncbi:MAG: polyprenyl synthetase family protein [Flexilinea sp.]|jgi:geranylgeranyl diphosphate synthase type I